MRAGAVVLALALVLTGSGCTGPASGAPRAPTSAHPAPPPTREPAEAAGGACQLLSFEQVAAALAVDFGVAGASSTGDTYTCVLRKVEAALPDLLTGLVDDDLVPLLGDADRGAGVDPGRVELPQHLGVGLHALADAPDDDRAGQAREGQVALAVPAGVGGRVGVELFEPGDRVTVRRAGRPAEQLVDLGLDRVAHHVLPPARLLVRRLVGQADDVDEQQLGEAVLAHHGDRIRPAGLREHQVPVALDREQAVASHPVDRLAHGWTPLVP